MSTIRERVGLWLLRHKRIRVDITCPHGMFVPSHQAIAFPRAPRSCDHCGYVVKVAFVDDPYRDGAGR